MRIRRGSAAALLAAGLVVASPAFAACSSQGAGTGGELEDDRAPADTDDEPREEQGTDSPRDQPTSGPTETVGVETE